MNFWTTSAAVLAAMFALICWQIARGDLRAAVAICLGLWPTWVAAAINHLLR